MKCPICGEENTLSISVLTQNERNYRINKDGTKSKRCKLSKDAYLDDATIPLCDNGCDLAGLVWEFIDGKLVFYNEHFSHGRKF